MFGILARISLFFGTFPYKYDREKNILQFSRLGAAMCIFASLCSTWLIGLLFRSISLGIAQFNPQTFLLTFIYGNISIAAIFRLVRQERLRKLLTKILRFYDRNRAAELYKNQKRTIYLITCLIMVEMVCFVGLSFIWVNLTPSTDWKSLLQKIYDVSIKTGPLCFIVMTPPCIELQFTILYAILRKATEILNGTLEQILMQDGMRRSGENIELELVRNRDEQSAIVKLIKATNRAYGFEMFFTSNMLMLLAIYLCNDTMLMLKTMSTLSFKVSFNLYASMVVFCRLGCICYESEKLTQEVKLTERIILKSDVNLLPTSLYLQVERYMFQLHQPFNGLSLCGFFHLNMEFVYNVAGNVVTFVLIFVQLNIAASWVQ